MFEYLRDFRVILVTGPQRSGTRICAKMIAHDTGHRYVDEREFGTGDLPRLKALIARESQIVVQCPAISARIEELTAKDIAIVFMRRPTDDIIASEKRIGWSDRAQQQAYVAKMEGLPISLVKCIFWEAYQSHIVDWLFDVSYAALSRHPLWVPKHNRSADWRWDQTEEEDGC